MGEWLAEMVVVEGPALQGYDNGARYGATTGVKYLYANGVVMNHGGPSGCIVDPENWPPAKLYWGPRKGVNDGCEAEAA